MNHHVRSVPSATFVGRGRFQAFAVSIGLSALVGLSAAAQGGAGARGLVHTKSGVTISNGVTVLHVEALRADVLRVRMERVGHPAEDASWAVLPEARAARVAVEPESDGFRTASLRVSVEADERLTVKDLAGNLLQEDAEPARWDGTSFRVSKGKTAADHFFGLGDKPGPLDRAGETFVMWNSDTFGWQESTDPIYKSIPFFIDLRQGRALGVLFDNTFRTFFDFGRERVDRYSFSAPDGPLDYYLLYGPDAKQVMNAYAWLTGPTPLPPKWALGYQQSRYTYTPRGRLEEVAARLRADRIPSDVLWLDIDFQYKNRPFTVDPVTFPDFPGLLHKMRDEHFHTVLITDLHVAHVPGQAYAPYDSGEAGDRFVKEHGQEYVGPVWPGPAVFPEFTQQGTRAWWGTLFKDFVADGAAGFWNDMNEPAVFVYPAKTMPDDVEHRIDEPGFAKRTAMHTEIHNVYGMENSRATEEGLLALQPNLRPFVMTRASYAGGQRYAATWTGDNSASWNHLRQTTPQLLNLGLRVFARAGADVGGVAGSPPADLLTKWLMLAAFQPIDRDHSAKGTRDHEPWVDGPAHEAIRRRYIEERYRLMPYLYTTAEETSRDGLPIVRPLFMEFPKATADGTPLDLEGGGEFMVGPDILVAAAASPEEVAPYEVHLAPGLWYDYWTGAPLDRRAPVVARDREIRDPAATTLKPIMVTPKLDELPVYVRAGAILPMQPLTQSTDEMPDGPLTLRVFPSVAGEPCAGDLYDDDGQSFNFRKGQYVRVHVSCRVAGDGSVTVAIGAPEGQWRPWWKAYRVEVVGLQGDVEKVQIGGNTVATEKTALGTSVLLPNAGREQTIALRPR